MKRKKLARKIATKGTCYNRDWGLRLRFTGAESATGFLNMGVLGSPTQVLSKLVKHKQRLTVELWTEIVGYEDGENNEEPVFYRQDWIRTWSLRGKNGEMRTAKELRVLAEKIAIAAEKFSDEVYGTE